MTAYRKRGTEVDAFRWTEDKFWPAQMPTWLSDLVALTKVRLSGDHLPGAKEAGAVLLYIDPPSGKGNLLVANVGDWIVRNARGDVFPMTAEKFAETYEAVIVESRHLDEWSRRVLEAASGE